MGFALCPAPWFARTRHILTAEKQISLDGRCKSQNDQLTIFGHYQVYFELNCPYLNECLCDLFPVLLGSHNYLNTKKIGKVSQDGPSISANIQQ